MEELIKQIAEVLSKIERDLLTACLAMTLLMFAMFCNQILGAVMARTGEENTFEFKRLLKSFLKGFLICIAILIFCVVLDVFPVLLERTNMINEESVLSTIVTALEVLVILVIAIVKYCKEVYQKLLTLLEINQEEVKTFMQQNKKSQEENG